jgi:hypothetical protein
MSWTDDFFPYRDWRDWVPRFIAPRVKILVVVDSSVKLNSSFGIGRALDVLNNETLGFVRLEVTVARRDVDEFDRFPRSPTWENFRFDQKENGAFIIDRFDQIWCFGFAPGNDDGPDGNITADPTHAEAPELAVLARWMDVRKGGVFATGDHDYLGASMCWQIPRVRSMRKWTNAQGVPPIGGPDRFDTNRGELGVPIPNSVQSDATPQPIEWRRYITSWNPLFRKYRPHPLLCGRDVGVIDVMPDHPHEGWIYEDDQIDLNASFSFAGAEFTHAGPEYRDAVDGGPKPAPEAIAWANTLPNPPYQLAKGPTPARRFPVLAAYDGHRAGVGRVVVDSTWHHWMDMNLEGLTGDDLTKVHTLFLNIAVWLARPSQQTAMMTNALWTGLFAPEANEELSPTQSATDLGASVAEILGRQVGDCRVREWTWRYFPVEIRPPFRRPPDPCLTCPPWDRLEEAILGGIVQEMLPVRKRALAARSAGKAFRPDEKELYAAVSQGAQKGLAAFHEALAGSLKRTQGVVESLAVAARAAVPSDAELTDEKRTMRIVLERVRVTAAESRLRGRPEVSFLAEVRLGDRVVARQRFPARGAAKLGKSDVLELQQEIWAGDVDADAPVTVALLATEHDRLGKDDVLERYVRTLGSGPVKGTFAPGDEKKDPESLGSWQVWLRSE